MALKAADMVKKTGKDKATGKGSLLDWIGKRRKGVKGKEQPSGKEK